MTFFPLVEVRERTLTAEDRGWGPAEHWKCGIAVDEEEAKVEDENEEDEEDEENGHWEASGPCVKIGRELGNAKCH